MISRGTIQVVVVAGNLAAFLLLASGALGQGAEDDVTQPGPAAGGAEHAADTLFDGAAAQKKADAEDEKEYRHRDEKAAKDDLAAQESMARSTERLVALTDRQIGLTFLELIALTITLIFTGWAAIKAGTAATAAVKAAEIAERSLNNSERAFVFVKSMYAIPLISNANRVTGWSFHVVWENSGSTPTQHMFTYKNLIAFGAPIPGNFDFPDTGDGQIPKTFVGPRAVKDAGGIDFPLSALEGVRDGRNHLYYWGWAEYGDVFNPNARHRSEFCARIVVIGDLARAPDERVGAPFMFVSHNNHNGSGDECYRQPITDKDGYLPGKAPKVVA